MARDKGLTHTTLSLFEEHQHIRYIFAFTVFNRYRQLYYSDSYWYYITLFSMERPYYMPMLIHLKENAMHFKPVYYRLLSAFLCLTVICEGYVQARCEG